MGSAMRLVLAVLVLMSWARRGGVATNVVAHRKKQRKADHDVIIEASMDQRKRALDNHRFQQRQWQVRQDQRAAKGGGGASTVAPR